MTLDPFRLRASDGIRTVFGRAFEWDGSDPLDPSPWR
jgi:hypothetical protein